MKFWQSILFSTVLLLSTVAAGGIIPGGPDMLVSTKWLSDHLPDQNLVLVQIGPNESEYAEGHIPNARFLPTEKISGERDGLKHELLPVNELIANLEAIGISNNSRVVIYASSYPTVATRLYWTLDYLGLTKNASLLEGGIAQWKAEKRPLSTDMSVASTPGTIKVRLRPQVLAQLSEVKAASATKNAILIDSRPAQRYEAGHIPGAISVFWQKTVPADSLSAFNNEKEIRKLYEKAGIKRRSKIIAYCETGFQATHTYFTLKQLGYNVKMYDGSFNEWNDVQKQPVVTGEKPR
jgi:thiosulfate/3-mercaptopyruvate sulfurtransferase